MKRERRNLKMKNVLYICIGALFAVLAFGSCNDAIDIRQDYDFSLSSWYLQEQIETGETVEIRFYLDREGDYEKAEYEIGYIQMEGKGEVTDSEGVRLVNREVRPLAEVPELDRENPVRQIFTPLLPFDKCQTLGTEILCPGQFRTGKGTDNDI